MLSRRTYSDSDIIAGCIRNQRKYQEILYRKYFEAMMRMCMRYTKDPEIAMSIVNDGFLKVFQNIDRYEDRGYLKAWIQKIVFRTLSDHFRKHAKDLQFMVLENYDTPEKPEALSDLFIEELLKWVDKLPEINRQVFSLFAIEGYTHKEIGDILQIPENTSKWHLSNARKILKDRILQERSMTTKRNQG